MRFTVPRMMDVKKPEDQVAFNSEVVSAFRALAKSAFLEEATITVTLGTSPTRVIHGLDHAPNWIIVDKNADANVWQVVGTPVDRRFFYLQASVAVTVKLLVF